MAYYLPTVEACDRCTFAAVMRRTYSRQNRAETGSATQAASNRQCADLMKRLAIWLFYGVGALAILYLALFAYATFTGRQLQPGDPIHIFRRPDAPSYS